MSNLPEWIQKHFRTCDCVEDPCKLDEALATAWEALGKIDRKTTINRDPHDDIQGIVGRFQNIGKAAKDAMRRIEEIGK